jgi:hypothetical protein
MSEVDFRTITVRCDVKRCTRSYTMRRDCAPGVSEQTFWQPSAAAAGWFRATDGQRQYDICPHHAREFFFYEGLADLSESAPKITRKDS